VKILVTVGMTRWPFDRLLRAITPLCNRHQVFAQTGASHVVPPCDHRPYVSLPELREHIRSADVVVTHAGNTVRLVQRAGKVPIAVARLASAGEMANDHQVHFLRDEERVGRVVAVWDIAQLAKVVEQHPARERELLASRPLAPPANACRVAQVLDVEWAAVAQNPFKTHPLRRYAYAWQELHGRTGRHLDLGCNTGTFVGLLSATSTLECYAADADAEHVRTVANLYPTVTARHVSTRGPLPFSDQFFDSVSLLDVLEHVPSEDALLREIRRVLRPGGLLVLSVPARHPFSWMDPDNIALRSPLLHRVVYSMRFGRAAYSARFVDRTDGLWGEQSIERRDHTNYRRHWLRQCMRAHGFEVTGEYGANLFWRWFQIPSLVASGRIRRALEWAIWLDGELFHRANFFATARRLA
jgi:SAM-dependent methyltransferase/UDP-N-acetylglucosamine transferase subunit ALG13